ncbi:MAG: HPr(Ser) kinase/phosphatase, partial [bacterium]|nr:HPr(Ser) kinase/phosphatase [bacterium]
MAIDPTELNRPSQPIAPLTVKELYELKSQDWELELVAGDGGLDATINTAELNRPGLALAGYYEVFSAERIQIIGLTESSFLKGLSPEERDRRIRRTLAFQIPCVIVTSAMEISEELRQICDERNIPLLRTSHITSPFQSDLGHYLERRLAPCWTMHGVMMDVFGMGVLIKGKSGVGKSECGLELIERGHRLIADDVVIVRRVGKDELVAEPSPNIGYHMEIRGIGIIDIELLFGVRAVREEAQISVIITLEKWDPEKEYERLGLSDHYATLFECKVPEYVLPVEPGRNIAKLIEVAALMQRLQDQGINVAKEFNKRILETIQKKRQPATKSFTAIERLYRSRVGG